MGKDRRGAGGFGTIKEHRYCTESGSRDSSERLLRATTWSAIYYQVLCIYWPVTLELLPSASSLVYSLNSPFLVSFALSFTFSGRLNALKCACVCVCLLDMSMFICSSLSSLLLFFSGMRFCLAFAARSAT